MADCGTLVEEIQEGSCPADQGSGATCYAGNVDNVSLGEAWDIVKDNCGQEPADNEDDTEPEAQRVVEECAAERGTEEIDSIDQLVEEVTECIKSKELEG